MLPSLGLALNGLGIDQDGDGDEDEFRGVNGFAQGAADDDEDFDDDDDGNKNYYDDIINSVNNSTRKGFGVGDEEDDMVEVLEDSSDEEEGEGGGKVAVQNLFNPSFADFESASAGGPAAGTATTGEGGQGNTDGPVEAWGSNAPQVEAFEADFGGVDSIPRSGSMGEGGGAEGGEGGGEEGEKGENNNTWADPFDDFEGSKHSARSDFFE